MRTCLSAVLLALAAGGLALPQPRAEPFTLHVLHLNDFHARYDETDGAGNACPTAAASRAPCYGGFARIASKARELLGAAQGRHLLLNAGDNFQGSLWYTLFTWNVTATFLNKLPFDATTLGNHEFDDGVAGVVPFLEHINFPTVVANMDASREPTMGDKFSKSIVLKRGGRLIGIVGYVMHDLADKATTGNLRFEDEASALSEEARRLTRQGVDIIVALSHAGLDVDRRVAATVRDVDIIVGGHSHSLLYTGTPPADDHAADVYPVLVTQEDGHKVAIVQAGAFGKYLGHLVASFDEQGELISATGNPVLLDSSVPQDESIMEDLVPWRQVVTETGNRVVGHTSVYLNASNYICRGNECNIGNFLTDAMVEEHLVVGQTDRWTRAAVALMNGGNIRVSIDETINAGAITYENILTVAPFQDTIDTVTMLGSTLVEVLEASVNESAVYTMEINGVNVSQHYAGSFLQQSGLKLVLDVRRPPGSRVVSISVRCAECRVPRYEPLRPDRWYTVAITSYMAQNRGTYHLLNDSVVNRTIGRLDTDVFLNYMKKHDPISHGIDGRTVVLY